MTDTSPSGLSSSPSPASPSQSSPRPSHVQDVGATIVSLVSIGAILLLAKWGFLADLPKWARPLASFGGVVLCGLPVSIRARILGTILRMKTPAKE